MGRYKAGREKRRQKSKKLLLKPKLVIYIKFIVKFWHSHLGGLGSANCVRTMKAIMCIAMKIVPEYHWKLGAALHLLLQLLL